MRAKLMTVLLVRHGRTTANVGGVLAGRSAGVRLDDVGERQAAVLASRLAPIPLAAVITSPMERCQQTASALLVGRQPEAPLTVDERVAEVEYGAWTGRPLKELAREPLWKVVQQHPSAAVFPDGEGLAEVQARAVAAIRAWNAELGPDAVYAVCSHGDVIKAILADALGAHLDQFQRIVVDPCSVSVITYTDVRPFVVRVNDVGGDISGLIPPKRRRSRRRKSSDAVVGGGSGPDQANA